MPADAPDPLASLDPSAKRAPARVRIAVGAAIVCFVVAVAVSAVLSASVAGDRGAIGGAAPLADGGGAADAPQGRAAEVGVALSNPVLVHVLGAVAEPGLVELGEGARVVDAVAAAGGFSADADPAGVNLARPVADGEQLVVPRVGELPPPQAAGAAGRGGGAGAADGLVHLNTADVAALDTLPRIGPALAQRILDWREANGGFTSVDQLREVAGIGDATFAGLVDLVAL
ncbi:ComEA family DNA-binding protein [Agromyces protaetiae]|uniref:ComEA family DNA-binding protein n=1 Tax=Agromyces protaetiae TaxID=2509455 RepID=A0A4P6FCY0_9MICO|nr:ComEA family DNA-binding protein [Agromyces protaetiae]QAY74150.1 ComEA family DNA-binding protein [Agromyces protaetiae]